MLIKVKESMTIKHSRAYELPKNFVIKIDEAAAFQAYTEYKDAWKAGRVDHPMCTYEEFLEDWISDALSRELESLIKGLALQPVWDDSESHGEWNYEAHGQ